MIQNSGRLKGGIKKSGSARGQRDSYSETLRAYVLFYAAFQEVLVSNFPVSVSIQPGAVLAGHLFEMV